MNMPSLEVLHAVIIIAWVECGSGRPSGTLDYTSLRCYSTHIIRRALDLRKGKNYQHDMIFEVFIWLLQTATLMANNLNIDREEHILKFPDEATRDILRSTFWAVAWLDILSSSGKVIVLLPYSTLNLAIVARVPSHLRLPHSTTGAPFMNRYIPSAGAFNRRKMYEYLKRLLSMMGFLSQVSMKAPIQNTSASRDAETVYVALVMRIHASD